MRFFYFLIGLLWVNTVIYQAQTPDTETDVIVLHSGKKLQVIIEKMGKDVVFFHYPNENVEEVLSKYAIEKIIYKSGREAEITDKINIKSEKDWQKVVIVDDEEKLIGLKRKIEITGKTSMINMHTTSSGDLKAEERLKREAAGYGCPFVLLTYDKTAVNATIENTSTSGDFKSYQTEHHNSNYQKSSFDANQQNVKTEKTQTVKKGVVYCYP